MCRTIWDIRKGGQASSRFPQKQRCRDGREIHHTAASRGGTENPQDNEGHAVSNRKPLTVGAIHPQSRCRVPFLPAASRENGHGSGP